MRSQFMQFTVVAVICAVAGGAAFAADTVIYNDESDGYALISGTEVFSAEKWDAEVDYAVYAPGQYPGNHVDKNTHYIYAYQLFNIPKTGYDVPLSSLSIGLASGSGADNVWYDDIYGELGGDIPYIRWFLPLYNPDPASVQWIGDWVPGNHSTVLLFSSPYTYTLDSATVVNGGQGDTQELPSPLPEPATMILLCGGIVPVLLRYRRKRQA